MANDILTTVFNAETKKDLDLKLKSIVRTNGWTERLAQAILNGLRTALEKGAPMGQVMKDTFEKATTAALEFAKEHPVYFTIIALGVLVVLAPWVIEALGFAELGPVKSKSNAEIYKKVFKNRT